MLFFAAFFWGSTFVAQSDAAEKLSPFTYLAARSYVGALTLACAIGIRKLLTKNRNAPNLSCANEKNKTHEFRATLSGGTICGIVLTAASALQQYGIHLGATAGEAGFLTAVYMFLVPLLSFLFYRKKVALNVLGGALLTAAGLYLLCIAGTERSAFGAGHILLLVGALAYAFHILAVDRCKDIDGMCLSCIQFTVCALISTVVSLILEHPSAKSILSAWAPILYAGVFSSAVAFTLQIYGQKYTPAAVATVLMSLESVIALLCEWLCAFTGLVGTPFSLSSWEIFGCALAFCGIVIAQLKFKKKKST